MNLISNVGLWRHDDVCNFAKKNKAENEYSKANVVNYVQEKGERCILDGKLQIFQLPRFHLPTLSFNALDECVELQRHTLSYPIKFETRPSLVDST